MTRVTVGTSMVCPDGTEVDITVKARVSTGEPERGPSFDCAGTPSSGPEVELLSAQGTDGKDYLAEIEANPEWLALVDDLCIGEAVVVAEDAESEWAERRSEEAREW